MSTHAAPRPFNMIFTKEGFEYATAVPPATVSILSWLTSVRLPVIVQVLTIVYLSIMISTHVWTFIKRKPRSDGKD